MLKVSVRYEKKGAGWWVMKVKPVGQWLIEDDRFSRKDEAVRGAVQRIRGTVESFGEPVSLRIYRKNGTIEEERTYPRKSDPRRSKG